jgi:predicted Zn-dependent protease
MENENIFFYDGNNARPTEVRVLLFSDALNIYDAQTEAFIISFPLKGTSTNQTGENYFIYPDGKGMRYLQLASNHPLLPNILKDADMANRSWFARLMKQRIIALIALMLLLIAGLYFLLITLVPWIGSSMITVNTEIKMGNQLKEVMLNEASMLGSKVDSAGTVNIQAFADKLKLSSNYPIRVTMVNSDIVNAYALPGGQVVVYSGMMNKIKTPEALAALLAHESSHVNERHTLRSLLRNAANGILISIIFNDATGITGGLISNADALNGLRYSRSLETEADRRGMELLMANAVDVKGMQELMKLLKEEGDIPETMSFLSTHPLTEERIREAQQFIKEHKQNGQKREDLEEAFKLLKN